MKLLVLSAVCIDEFACEVPQSFVVDLHPDDIKEIQTLATEVKRLGVASIDKHFAGGRWTSFMVEDFSEEGDKSHVLRAASDKGLAVQVPMLKVYERYFAFYAVPKHGTDQCIIRTPPVEIEELSDHSAYFEEDPHSVAA